MFESVNTPIASSQTILKPTFLAEEFPYLYQNSHVEPFGYNSPNPIPISDGKRRGTSKRFWVHSLDMHTTPSRTSFSNIPS